MPFIDGKFYMNPGYGRAVEGARAAGNSPSESAHQQGAHWVTIGGRHVLIGETRAGQKPPINASVRVAQEPQIVQNLRLGQKTLSGVGAQLQIRFSDSSGKPLAGASVSESNKEGAHENPGTITTDPDGASYDWVMKAGPSKTMPGTPSDLKNYVNTHPITVTSTQTLAVTAAGASYKVTWTRTLTNLGSGGKLNTKFNSHGVNFTVTWTHPEIRAVSR